jgi:hypothetical protein
MRDDTVVLFVKFVRFVVDLPNLAAPRLSMTIP